MEKHFDTVLRNCFNQSFLFHKLIVLNLQKKKKVQNKNY